MEEKKILMVDDEQMMIDLYSEAFTKAGYAVRTAGNAEDALEILKHEQFLVMFLDLNLPGMSGVELCRKIREGWPMAITYAVTGYASLFELTECRDAGFEDYFTKPTKLKDLLDAAENAFIKLARWKKNGQGKRMQKRSEDWGM